MPRPTLEQLPRDYSWVGYLVVVVVFSLFFNPVVVVLATILIWVKRRWPELRRYIWLSAVLATGWLIYRQGIFFLLLTEGVALPKAILIGFPLVPLVTICLEASGYVIKALKPFSHTTWIIRLRRLILKEQEKIRESLIAEARHAPPRTGKGVMMLGPIWPEEKYIGFPKTVNVVIKPSQRYIHNQPAQWLGLKRKIWPEHTICIGQTGSGKSETIKRDAYETVTQTHDYGLLLIDGKGDDSLCDDFRAICALGNRGPTPVFRLGHTARPSHPYHGFVGTGLAVQNRLMALLKLDEVSGDAKYYAKAAMLVLQLLCQYDPNGTPRSFHALQQRCDLNYLEVAFKEDLVHLAQIKTLKEKDIRGLVYDISVLANDLAAVVNPNGFVIGGDQGVRSAVFSLRTQSAGVSAAQYFEMLSLDLLDVMNRHQGPLKIYIDEISNITKNTHHVLKMATMNRAFEKALFVASQSPTNLGDKETTREIVRNMRNRILMASDKPDEISELAGTLPQIEQTLQTQEGENTTMGTVGARETFAITPNDVGQLAPGEAFFFRQRCVKKILIKQVTNLPDPPPEPQAKEYIPEAPDIQFQGKRLTL